MIEMVGLGRDFESLVAVDDIDLKVKDGEVFGFLGPNGAGKTTTVRMLCTLIAPTRGTAYVNGMDIRDRGQHERIRQNVGLLPENPGLYESLTAWQNLEFFAKMYGVGEKERSLRINELLDRLDLKNRKEDPVATFSKGMKQKVAIARALVHEPTLLFLDEPTSGLDPVAALTVREFIAELKREGRTIFINTHNLDDAERLCDRIGVIRTRLLATGNPKELADSFFGRGTIVQLDRPRPDLVSVVIAIPGVISARADGDRIIASVDDPEQRNPAIVSALVGAGANVRYILDERRSLEDVYMKVVGR